MAAVLEGPDWNIPNFTVLWGGAIIEGIHQHNITTKE